MGALWVFISVLQSGYLVQVLYAEGLRILRPLRHLGICFLSTRRARAKPFQVRPLAFFSRLRR